MELLIVFTLFLAITQAFDFRRKDFENTGRVIGMDAPPDGFKYAAMLEPITKSGAISLCAGSLIGSEWILTAAHCVEESESVMVYLGATLHNKAKITYRVSKDNIIIHPQYSIINFHNDISLIRIPTTKSTTEIKPIRLPKKALLQSSYEGQYAIASGWGKTKSAPFSNRLQYARNKIISNKKCKKNAHDLVSTELCVDVSNSIRVSHGDSGGPLVLELKNELVGVVASISTVRAVQSKPPIFTRVTKYLQWIKSVTNISY